MSHILDPRTGMPAEGVLSATILAPRATDADALATAAFVLGPEAMAPLFDEHPDWSALFLVPGKRDGLEAVPFNLADDLQLN